MIPPLAAFTRREGARPRLTGHRGVRREGGPPENTLAAFTEAAREGADAIELDVRLSASGDVVVLHDPTLERVTGGVDGRSAADMSTRELRAVDLGGGATIPTLVEALSLAKAARLAVNVELKHDVPSRPTLARAVARVLAAWDRRHAVIASSFDPAVLAMLAPLAPWVPRALLVHRTWYHRIAALAVAPSLAQAVHLERTIATPALIRALRARRLVIQVWTVNRVVEARDLAALGVDGFITDTPADLAAAL